MRDKLYSINYNVLTLCKTRYLYNFIFNNLKTKYAEISTNSVDDVILITNLSNFFITVIIKDLKKTFFAILFLILQLPRYFF